jgi:hypothetical protein
VNPATATQNAAGYFIRRACRRLPADIRDECCREWTAETWAILNDTTARPAARRHLAALRYATDHIRGTRHHPHARRPKRLRVAISTRQRLQAIATSTAIAVSAVSAVTGLVFMFPGVRRAAGGFGEAFGSIVATASSILVTAVVIYALSARRRRGTDHEPRQGT